MPGHRIDRINEEIKHQLDAIIRRDVRDPRVAEATLSLTRVEVTRDFRYAKAYVSVLEEDKRAGVMAALKSAAGFLRRELGHKVDLRYTPELIFEPDANIAYAAHISEILAKDKAQHGD